MTPELTAILARFGVNQDLRASFELGPGAVSELVATLVCHYDDKVHEARLEGYVRGEMMEARRPL